MVVECEESKHSVEQVENTGPHSTDINSSAPAVPRSRSRRIIKTERVELALPQSHGPEVEE